MLRTWASAGTIKCDYSICYWVTHPLPLPYTLPYMYTYIHVHICILYSYNCLLLPSNQSFYRLITSYTMGGANCEVAKWWEGVNGKHSTMHVMHPNQGHVTIIYMYMHLHPLYLLSNTIHGTTWQSVVGLPCTWTVYTVLYSDDQVRNAVPLLLTLATYIFLSHYTPPYCSHSPPPPYYPACFKPCL